MIPLVGKIELVIENLPRFSQIPVGMPTAMNKTTTAFCGLALSTVGLAHFPSAVQAAEVISFNNQIQPILSEYCYPCHGPDSATRKPKKRPLRLDREQFAFEPRDDGKPVIIKGDAKASEVIRRLKATDDDVMPPASEHKKLKLEEIALIEKWITQGAKYEKHWSLIPPSRPAVPGDGKGWARNEIDRFVARKLNEQGLKPNPEERKARLFRRLSFDLRGLPPSPQEVRDFLNDKDPRAYEKAVDRMLATDACAEQFTRHWLDAVRYADTQGIHHDHSRSIWPYRDWVLAAFKANLPFDRFTLEQIAGDLLPAPTTDQKIASGYNRLLPTTGEGGAIPEEYAAIYAKDRVETTSAVWLGLTTGCATCHDHKFDPIKMKDFYSMTAFFRNSTVPALDSSTNGNTAPLLFLPAKQDLARWPELERELAAKKQAIDERKRQATPDFEKWVEDARNLPGMGPASGLEISEVAAPSESAKHIEDPATAVAKEALPPVPSLYLPLIGTNVPFRGTAGSESVEWPGENEQRPGPFGEAPRVSQGIAVEKAAPTFTRNGQATYGALIYVEQKPSGAVFSRMNKAEGFRGWDLFLSEGRPLVHVIDQFPDTSLKVTAKEALKPGRWHHVMAVFDGSRNGAEAISLYINAQKAEVEVNNNNLGSNIVADVPFRLGGRSDKDGAGDTLKNGKVFLQDLRFYNYALSGAEVGRLAVAALAREYLVIATDQRTVEQSNTVYDLFISGFDQPSEKLRAELAQLMAEEDQIRQRGATTLIMEEKKDTEPVAHMLIRGNYAAKGAEVPAATPEALPPMTPDMPHNRLGLARWILSRDNPLAARVTVNRLWAPLFGIGIVETTEDFGVKGARPSNRDLLDWLAVEFMDSGWDLRHIVKTMVMSATYRQSEKVPREKLEKDPLNKLFARGPHVRLEAEEIRDQALAASGLLVQKIGGPPVNPYQPEGVWEAVAMKDSNTRVYVQDKGEALHRRSLYTFWKRAAPPPALEILNAPSREVSCTRRDRTDTPLQAFVTMNDPQYVEAARQLAARAISQGENFDARLDAVTEPLLARRLAGQERAVVRKLEERALKTYRHDTAAAEALIAVGESRSDEKLPPADLAAWTLVASQIMNLDECLTK